MALGPALISLSLPDTSHTDLPEQVADAEKIDAPKNNENTVSA